MNMHYVIPDLRLQLQRLFPWVHAPILQWLMDNQPENLSTNLILLVMLYYTIVSQAELGVCFFMKEIKLLK